MIEAFVDAIDCAVADILFGVFVLGLFIIAVCILLYAGLALRGFWRWVAHKRWSDVILIIERRALRK